MGLFYVSGRLSGPTGRSESVDLQVDTGATFLVVPVTTPCLIAEGGSALLGAVALESLLLAVDPVAKRLVPIEGLVG